MAKRRSKERLNADRIIKKELLKFGDVVLEEAVPNSRRDTGRLQDEMNFRVEKDTTINFAQMWYGSKLYPAGKNSGELNPLKIAIKENINANTKAIIKKINDFILKK